MSNGKKRNEEMGAHTKAHKGGEYDTIAMFMENLDSEISGDESMLWSLSGGDTVSGNTTVEQLYMTFVCLTKIPYVCTFPYF